MPCPSILADLLEHEPLQAAAVHVLLHQEEGAPLRLHALALPRVAPDADEGDDAPARMERTGWVARAAQNLYGVYGIRPAPQQGTLQGGSLAVRRVPSAPGALVAQLAQQAGFFDEANHVFLRLEHFLLQALDGYEDWRGGAGLALGSVLGSVLGHRHHWRGDAAARMDQQTSATASTISMIHC